MTRARVVGALTSILLTVLSLGALGAAPASAATGPAVGGCDTGYFCIYVNESCSSTGGWEYFGNDDIWPAAINDRDECVKNEGTSGQEAEVYKDTSRRNGLVYCVRNNDTNYVLGFLDDREGSSHRFFDRASTDGCY